MRQPVVTDKAARPIGPYSQAIIEGDLVFLAGQGPARTTIQAGALPGGISVEIECTARR